MEVNRNKPHILDVYVTDCTFWNKIRWILGKVIIQLISNLVYAFVRWVVKTDALLGYVGPILAL